MEEKQVSEGRPASGYSINQNGKKISDEQIKEFILEMIAGECSNYGYRKLSKEMDILRPQRRKRTKYPRKLAQNRTIMAFNQLWEADIKYGYIQGEDRFFFICSLIDIYDRAIIDYHIGLECTAENVVQALNRALVKRQQFEHQEKPVIRTDNGPQFISNTFEKSCKDYEMGN